MMYGRQYNVSRLMGMAICALALFAFSFSIVEAQSGKPKVLMVVTGNDTLNDGSPAGYFFPEAVDFYVIMKQNGYDIGDVDVVSPSGGKASMYQRNIYLRYPVYLALPERSEFLAKFDNTLAPNQVDPTKYRAIYYVGGFASMFDYPYNVDLASIARAIYERGGVIAAICHGTCALVPITLSDGSSLLEGKKIATRSFEEDSNVGELSREDVLYYLPFILEDFIADHGGVPDIGEAFTSHVVVSDRIVTGQNSESTDETAWAVMELLEGIASAGSDDAESAGLLLEQNLPNPFSSGAVIRYSVPASMDVRLGVFNLTGEMVLSLVDGPAEPGIHDVRVDGTMLPPGTYFYRLEAGGRSTGRTMTIVK